MSQNRNMDKKRPLTDQELYDILNNSSESEGMPQNINKLLFYPAYCFLK